MSGRRRLSGARSSRGVSLIELMVSMAVGLLVVITVLFVYQGVLNANKMANGQGSMNEDAQAALIMLTQQLRMAGNNPAQSNRVEDAAKTHSSRRNPIYNPAPTHAGFALQPAGFALSSFALRGCDGNFSNLQTSTDVDTLNCAAGASTSPDAIALSYEADQFNTVPTSTGLPTDCLGKKLATITATLPTLSGTVIENTDVAYAKAVNYFYIDQQGSVPGLYCKGNGVDSTPQALVEDIEDLQFIYGVSAAAKTIAGYLSADQIRVDPTLSTLPSDAQRWEKVIAVRICIVARSRDPIVANALSARYLKCDGSLETAPPDLRLRRAYSTTVLLRNRQS
jgi:type IV pilus assembly protein PilW